jgi:hypothetical protein
MNFGWKRLVPVTLALILLTAITLPIWRAIWEAARTLRF